MTDPRPETHNPHPFETPAAESFFKALLWIMLILQIIVFARLYNRVVAQLPDRPSSARIAAH